MENYVHLVSYSPSMKTYRLMCIGGEKERIQMQQNIDAHDSDEIVIEVSAEQHAEIYDDMYMMCKIRHF